VTAASPLARWYASHGRHHLPWRATRDRWLVLVSEVMLHQTQVNRVLAVWPEFSGRFATPAAMAAAGPGAVIEAWGRLGYPRRARRLWEAAVEITAHGWPADLRALPGVGRYTAGAVTAQADDADTVAVDVNVRRVVERVAGQTLSPATADEVMRRLGRGLGGRERLLALMDLGSLVCRPRDPACGACPLRRRCRTRGPLPEAASRRRQPTYAGSFRQRRGQVLAALRAGPAPVDTLDPGALDSLVTDGLAVVEGATAGLPRA
jgi:A/G-specific adenine glycosylase